MTITLGGITLHPSIALLGERANEPLLVNVVHGYGGGATVQTAPGIEAGIPLQLESREDDQIWGYWTWSQIESLRAKQAAGLAVSLSYHGRAYSVLIIGGWETMAPIMAKRTATQSDTDRYVGTINLLTV